MSVLPFRSLALPDGRQLAWAEYGDPAGRPVLFFPGSPGSRLPLVPRQDSIAAAAGVRLLAVERPGFGDSSRHPDRTLIGWADDVACLVRSLAFDRFAVIGYSGGAPHALACAARLEGHLTRAVAVGCGAPWDNGELARLMDWQRRVLRRLALHTPWLLRLTYRSLPDPGRKPEKLVRQMLAGLGPADRATLARPEVFRIAVDATAAALVHGPDGMADEVLVLARPWGFDLGSIAVPVTLWCGTQDTAAPVAMSEHLAARIPGAELRRLEGEGHLCLIDHLAEILESTR